jgi:glutathione S-transferase
MKIKLYEFGPTRAIRVRWTLQELGVDFEPIRVSLWPASTADPSSSRSTRPGSYRFLWTAI